MDTLTALRDAMMYGGAPRPHEVRNTPEEQARLAQLFRDFGSWGSAQQMEPPQTEVYEGPREQFRGKYGTTELPVNYHPAPWMARGMRENGWLPSGATDWDPGIIARLLSGR